MRNLVLLSENHIRLKPAVSQSTDPRELLSWIATDSVSAAVIPVSAQEYFHIRSGHSETSGHRAIPPEHFHIVGAEYLIAENGLFLATAEGTLLLSSEFETTILGHITEGIATFKWSLDQEVLVMVTRVGPEGAHIEVMTADWMPVATLPLDPQDQGEQVPVTVGWGKKETQFHGSEGKEAAKARAEVAVPVSDLDDLQPRISWRGDGQFFAVSSVNPASRTRIIRVYDRQGILQNTSEPVNGLEWCLAWKPSGSLIASSAVSAASAKREIVFFEKNGLRHGEFQLPFPMEKSFVKDIMWNCSSDILLVWMVITELDGSTTDCLTFWYISNYHWYLKQSLRFPRATAGKALVACTWNGHDPYVLHLTDTNGRLTTQEWMLTVARSSDTSASVAVIDGSRVLITSFSLGIVPPPSCHHTIQLDSRVNQVMFYSFTDFYEIAIMTDHKTVLIFYCDPTNPAASPILRKTLTIPFMDYPKLFWNGRDALGLVEAARTEHAEVWGLWTFSVHRESQRELESLPSMEFLETDKTCRLLSYFDSPIIDCTKVADYILVTLANGSVVKLIDVPSAAVASKFRKFPQGCDKVLVDQHGDAVTMYGLNSVSHKLYRDSELINDSCTSFTVANGFLLYTTHHHKLICVALDTERFGSLTDSRELERGSRIVNVVTNRTEVILQLPRGNLETIHPRALVVGRVRQLSYGGHYAQAFDLVRRNRINMNLLVDVDPEKFLSDMKSFVQQIGDSTNLNIFIAELDDDNVTKTMYANHFLSPSHSIANKRNVVLNRLDEVLREMPAEDYFLSRLACNIYKKPTELEDALYKVKDLRFNPESKISAEEALKFILYSADVDELFNIALGTYDFDLVLMVGAKSRKDPKEYIPFLNNFRQMQPPERRYFAIDMHLKRYGKALQHLASLGAEAVPECMDLVVKHGLYKDGLQVFSQPGKERSQILHLYGKHLVRQHKIFEAAVAFDEGDHFDEATDNYRKCLEWQLAMNCAKRAGWEEQKIVQTAKLAAAQLVVASRHMEAGNLLLNSAKDPNSAFETLLDGHCWSDALLLLDSILKDATSRTKLMAKIELCHQDVEASIEQVRQEVEKHRRRLLVVRHQKKENKEKGIVEDPMDNMSETSSVSGRSGTSRSSRGSRSSGKSKRRDEKKKRSLREGGPYEELALLAALKDLYRQADGMIPDMGRLLRISLKCGLMEKGKTAQQAFGSLLQDLSIQKKEIWTPNDFMSAVSANSSGPFMYGPNATSNRIAADMMIGAGDSDLSDVSLTDLVLFIPPELNLTAWNECKIDQFDL